MGLMFLSALTQVMHFWLYSHCILLDGTQIKYYRMTLIVSITYVNFNRLTRLAEPTFSTVTTLLFCQLSYFANSICWRVARVEGRGTCFFLFPVGFPSMSCAVSTLPMLLHPVRCNVLWGQGTEFTFTVFPHHKYQCQAANMGPRPVRPSLWAQIPPAVEQVPLEFCTSALRDAYLVPFILPA